MMAATLFMMIIVCTIIVERILLRRHTDWQPQQEDQKDQ